MLPLRGRILCGKPEVHFSGKCFLCVVAFSAENRKSTFPENASFAWSHSLRKTGSPLFRKMLPLRGRIFCGKPEVHFSGKCFLCVVAFSAENRKSTFPENASFAWSHFLRKTGSPLFRKMLPLRGRIFCGKPEVHFSGKCFLCVVAFSAE